MVQIDDATDPVIWFEKPDEKLCADLYTTLYGEGNTRMSRPPSSQGAHSYDVHADGTATQSKNRFSMDELRSLQAGKSFILRLDDDGVCTSYNAVKHNILNLWVNFQAIIYLRRSIRGSRKNS